MPATPASQNEAGTTGETAGPVPAKFRYATKTALSLTLAYLIPMALGWPQPQTAATTVMLIAATGMVSESLQKGVLRVLGTVLGAVVGLTLIALFPQDRILYLLAASLAVSGFIYLYNAYQGDSTLFMLAAVVTLMVFNGGDAEGAFLYGVDRAFMTVFGVLVYTIVASLLWPVKTADNTRALASTLATAYAGAFARLVRPETYGEASVDEQLAALLASEEAFQKQYAAVKGSADGITDYLAEWNTVLACYEQLEAVLVPALKQQNDRTVDYGKYIEGYDALISQLEDIFRRIDSNWQGQPAAGELRALEFSIIPGSLAGEGHLVIAAVATRADLLAQIQDLLLELDRAQGSLLFDRGGFRGTLQPSGKPAFVWLDLENFKTALRALMIFWVAAGIWIGFNPPGGFTFVTMCTILIPLVSYTPVTPRLLMILFTLGFLFALPAYVFLLPAMSHWLELALFLFAYAFIGFYLFKGPVSIFFLLGLFTLGIQNTMSYNMDAILSIMLMFYMVCAMQIISIYFPFTSKPERLYASLRRRFFLNCAGRIRLSTAPAGPRSWLRRHTLGSGSNLLTKLQHWGSMIDTAYFPGNGQQQIAELGRACEVLHGQLQIAARRRQEFSHNPLVRSAYLGREHNPLAELCDTLAGQGPDRPFEAMQRRLADIGRRIDELIGEEPLSRYSRQELAQFYVYLNLQASTMNSIQACRDAQHALDWQQLREPRF